VYAVVQAQPHNQQPQQIWAQDMKQIPPPIPRKQNLTLTQQTA
jgi:hypothetical protein